MDMKLYDAVKNYLLNGGNDYWVYDKYLEHAKIFNTPWLENMEAFLDDPYIGSHKVPLRDLIHLMKNSDFDPDDTFVWYDGEKLHSGSKVFPDLCDVDTVATFICKNYDDLEDEGLQEIMIYERED